MAGAVAERMTLMAYMGYTCLMTAWVSHQGLNLKGPQCTSAALCFKQQRQPLQPPQASTTGPQRLGNSIAGPTQLVLFVALVALKTCVCAHNLLQAMGFGTDPTEICNPWPGFALRVASEV